MSGEERIAVILIHGVGEQMPMDSLKSFANAALLDIPTGSTSRYRERCWSVYDDITQHTELKKLKYRPEKKGEPKVDFYEFYWANIGSEGRVQDSFVFIFNFLFSWPISKSKKLKFYWIFMWTIVFAIIFFFASIFSSFDNILYEIVSRAPIIGYAIENINHLFFKIPYIAPFILSFIFVSVGYFVNARIGSVARYFGGSPRHVGRRDEIRKRGIELLDKLHKTNLYDKVIVVGHSLGSVIAYELIQNYWSIVYRDFSKFPDKEFVTISNAENKLTGKTAPIDSDEMRIIQQGIFEEIKYYGNTWRISDFISIGSPLAYIDWIARIKGESLEELLEKFEIVTCPPLGREDEQGISRFSYPKQISSRDKSSIGTIIRIPNHGSPFAATRWTNIYFGGGIFSHDPIGGKLARILGTGIKDISLRYDNFSFFLGSHMNYWTISKSNNNIKAIQEALHIDR